MSESKMSSFGSISSRSLSVSFMSFASCGSCTLKLKSCCFGMTANSLTFCLLFGEVLSFFWAGEDLLVHQTSLFFYFLGISLNTL